MTASDASRLCTLSVRSVSDIYQHIRVRLAQYCSIQSPFNGELETDESYFGSRRVRGKRGRGAAELARRDAERKEWVRIDAERQQAAHAAAAQDACPLWDAASASGTSAYLARKGVQAHGLRFAPDGCVLVPASIR